MIYIWLIYFLISILIAFCTLRFFHNIFLKALIFSIILSFLTAIWFKSPGESMLVPVLSIFLLEASILDNNGIARILRPLSILTIFYFLISYVVLKKSSKN